MCRHNRDRNHKRRAQKIAFEQCMEMLDPKSNVTVSKKYEFLFFRHHIREIMYVTLQTVNKKCLVFPLICEIHPLSVINRLFF
jgi:hypothetical protein